MADFGSCRSVTDRSDALQIVRGGAIDFSTVYGTDYTNMSFLCYHGSVRRSKGMWGNIERGVVLHGGIRTCYLTYALPIVYTCLYC